MENVILAKVDGLAAGYDAMRSLQDLSDEGMITLRGAAIVERHPDGRWHIPEETEDASYGGAITGGGIGGLIGLLAGPAGLLLGATAGALVGGAAEKRDIDDVEMMVRGLAARVPPGTTAVVADVEELSHAAVDDALRPHTSAIQQLSRAEVEAELARDAEATGHASGPA